MSNEFTTVELANAYVWDCEECGRENFQRAISVVLNPDDESDAEIIRSEHGIAPHEPIPNTIRVTMQTRPNRVTCKHCETEFAAVDTNGPTGEV